MGQVDRVLIAGARDSMTLPDTATDEGQAALLDLNARVADITGVDQGDVDAILCMAAKDAAPLIADAASVVVRAVWPWQNDGTAALTIECPRHHPDGCTWWLDVSDSQPVALSYLVAIADAHNAQVHGQTG